MPISFYDISVGTHIRGLSVLTNILNLAKADALAKNIPIDELVTWRLIDDMKPLSFQIHYACKVTEIFLRATTDLEVPEVQDKEETFADLEARLSATSEFLRSIDRARIEGIEDGIAKLQASETKWGDFTNFHFLLGTNLPNFYFHLVTAYDVLRAKGVDLGKRDYLRPHFASFVNSNTVHV